MQNPKLNRFLRIPEICKLLGGVHPSTVYRNAGKNGFPPLVEVLPNVTGMSEAELVEYLKNRPLRREQPAKAVQAAIRGRKAQKKIAGGRS